MINTYIIIDIYLTYRFLVKLNGWQKLIKEIRVKICTMHNLQCSWIQYFLAFFHIFFALYTKRYRCSLLLNLLEFSKLARIRKPLARTQCSYVTTRFTFTWAEWANQKLYVTYILHLFYLPWHFYWKWLRLFNFLRIKISQKFTKISKTETNWKAGYLNLLTFYDLCMVKCDNPSYKRPKVPARSLSTKKSNRDCSASASSSENEECIFGAFFVLTGKRTT